MLLAAALPALLIRPEIVMAPPRRGHFFNVFSLYVTIRDPPDSAHEGGSRVSRETEKGKAEAMRLPIFPASASPMVETPAPVDLRAPSVAPFARARLAKSLGGSEPILLADAAETPSPLPRTPGAPIYH